MKKREIEGYLAYLVAPKKASVATQNQLFGVVLLLCV